MPSKAEERWKRLAAMGAKGVIPTPEGDTFPLGRDKTRCLVVRFLMRRVARVGIELRRAQLEVESAQHSLFR